MNLLSLLPDSWRVWLAWAVLCLIGGALCWRFYEIGYGKAQAEGRAEIAELKSEHDRAYAKAVGELNTKILEQTRRAVAAVSQLETERAKNAKNQSKLQGKIASVTAYSNHTFSADFVRMWNQATGAFRGGAVPGTGNPPGADGSPGAGKRTGAGILATGAVTEADVLAFILYYGERCKNLEAQVNAWIDLFSEGENRHESR